MNELFVADFLSGHGWLCYVWCAVFTAWTCVLALILMSLFKGDYPLTPRNP